tara:strand:- start:307 stop:1203 length:897 start_codon:yes stop_codon:yes gene_type:complete
MEQSNETSTILLTRKKAFTFALTDVEVSFNGSKVALLKNGGSESITIPAGTHTIVILPVGFASMFAESYQMVFVAQAGESYSFLIEPDFQNFKISLLSSSESIKKATLESVPSTQTEAVKQEQPLEPNDAKPLEQIDSQDQQILQEQQEPQDKVQVNSNTMDLDDEHNTLPPNPYAIVYKGCLIPILGFIGFIIVLNVVTIYQDYQEEQRRIEYKERALEEEKKRKEKYRYDEERTNPAYKGHKSGCMVGLNARRKISARGEKDFFEGRVLTESEIYEKYRKCMNLFKGKKYLYGPDS